MGSIQTNAFFNTILEHTLKNVLSGIEFTPRLKQDRSMGRAVFNTCDESLQSRTGDGRKRTHLYQSRNTNALSLSFEVSKGFNT